MTTTVSISSRPSEASKRLCSCDVVLTRSVATTCQPRLRYSSAKAKPRPRDAPMRRSCLLDEGGGIYNVPWQAIDEGQDVATRPERGISDPGKDSGRVPFRKPRRQHFK